MNSKRVASQIVVGIGLVMSLATFAEAQATRTWVSGVGDDANPCSRTAPCKTFAGAISKTATGGYINATDPAGFGAVTITKSITIDGGPFMAGVLSTLGSNGIIINGAGINVTLRNLDIEGAGTGANGISILNAANVHVENVHITNWAQNGINFASSSGALLFVSNVSVRHAANQGILVGGTGGRVMANQYRAESNGSGIRVNANGILTLRDSYLAGNGEGITTAAVSAIANVENVVITGNVFGINGGGGTLRLSNTDILSNTNTGMFNDGTTTIISLGGNQVQGNPTPGAFTQTLAKL